MTRTTLLHTRAATILAALCVCLCTPSVTHGWPGMGGTGRGAKPPPSHHHGYYDESDIVLDLDDLPHGHPRVDSETTDSEMVIGPACTVNAHNSFQSQKCPTMVQPPPPQGSTPLPHGLLRTFPNNFVMQWTMMFVYDDADVPPYSPVPKTSFNVTTGRTFYHVIDENTRNMREQYDKYCIPVFGDPSSPMGSRNDFSCDFINVGVTNTSYVVTHSDRPEGVPECCIIGKPFHPPPPDFAKNMPLQYRQTMHAGTTYEELTDSYCVYDQDAGPFCYSFNTHTGAPTSFMMKGVPWLASWLWQKFYNFQPDVQPSEDTWELPDSCSVATACPGWDAWPADSA
eukprot:GFYU01009233.1.p1 GENE.GFYU01009233.1~~GFYU01009233.1.p1  ORF type:complete len:341 (-),score=75.81 GFYU01009233.1:47-1069(-)